MIIKTSVNIITYVMNYRIVYSGEGGGGQIPNAMFNFTPCDFKVNINLLQIPELTAVKMHAIRSVSSVNGFTVNYQYYCVVIIIRKD